MISRSTFLKARLPDAVSRAIQLSVELHFGSSDSIPASEATPERESEVLAQLLDRGMRFVYGDVEQAMQECYRSVMQNLGMGANDQRIEQAFKKMRESVSG